MTIDQKRIAKELSHFTWASYYEEPAHVLAMFMATRARTKFIEKTAGEKLTAMFSYINDKVFRAYTNLQEEEKIAQAILDKVIHQKEYFPNVKKQIANKAKELIDYSKNLESLPNQLSAKELADYYRGFVDRFIGMRIYSSLPTLMEHVANAYTKFLEEKISSFIKDEEEKRKAFSIFTTPQDFSYVTLHEIDLLNLVKKFKYKSADFNQALKNHTRKWTWLDYTFEGTPLLEKDFKKKMEEKISEGIDPEKEIRKIYDSKKKLEVEKLALIERYHIPNSLVKFLDYGADIVYIKFFRKGIFAQSYYYMEFLLGKIAKYLKTDLDVIRNMFDWEVYEALESGRVDSKKILERIHFSMIFDYRGLSFEVTDKRLKEIIENNIISEKKKEKLAGQTAFPGDVTGLVKIINDVPEMKKMKQGDILVARTTNPKLLPAMKLAAAIVTDTGGLTCHAAIVSREFEIPCVVGTKNATKILKDGDQLQVDANKGIVKIIKN